MENLVNDDVEVVAPGSSLLKQLRKKGMMKKKQQSRGGLFGDLLHTHNKGKLTPLNEGDDTSTDQLQALRNAQSQISQEAKAPVDFDWNDKHDGSDIEDMSDTSSDDEEPHTIAGFSHKDDEDEDASSVFVANTTHVEVFRTQLEERAASIKNAFRELQTFVKQR